MTEPTTIPRDLTGAPTARYPVARDSLPPDPAPSGPYAVRFARTAADLDAILRLRFQVFNLELNEGLVESYVTGRDEDDLDVRFHHLMIADQATGEVVGTSRMQTPEMAAAHGGFYTAGEFDLSGMPERLVERSVEIGRACVAKAHRNGRVLHLLWRGLAGYVAWNRKTALFGCCSLTSQDAALGVATFRHLEAEGRLHPEFTIAPLPEAECRVEPGAVLPPPHVPALFQSYLSLGALVCGPPAIDRLFRTIDFLVLMDIRRMDPKVFRHLFG